MLNLLLACLLFVLLLDLESELPPLSEEACHVLHPVVCVEESSHGVEQIFIPVQILFFLDELQFESCPHGLILE